MAGVAWQASGENGVLHLTGADPWPRDRVRGVGPERPPYSRVSSPYLRSIHSSGYSFRPSSARGMPPVAP